jgi:hypothetical protein
MSLNPFRMDKLLDKQEERGQRKAKVVKEKVTKEDKKGKK